MCFFSLFSTALSLLQGKIAPENVHVLMYQSYLNYFFGEIGLKSCLIPCKFRESWRVNSSSIYTIYTHRAYSILYVFIINLLETFELSMRLPLLERKKGFGTSWHKVNYRLKLSRNLFVEIDFYSFEKSIQSILAKSNLYAMIEFLLWSSLFFCVFVCVSDVWVLLFF